jgi:transcriptional regulator with XRE-family HTH domain
MNPSSLGQANPASELGPLLRHWRAARGKSQLDLSLDTEISQRHLSFIESGRSVPGRETLLIIAQVLDIPLRERNTLLLAAGYAPVYSESVWNASEMQSITKALERILRQHEPFPAVVMDRYWNVVITNDAAPRFFNCFIDMSARKGPRNLLHLMFDPKGMRPFIANWEHVIRELFQRVHRESVGRVIDEKTKELLESLQAYPDVKTELEKPSSLSSTPVIPIGFVKRGKTLNYFSMVTTVGSPQSITAQELRLECLCPADEGSEKNYLEMMAVKANAKIRKAVP